MFMYQYQNLLDSKHPHCVCCNADLTGNIIDFYNHEYGWKVDGYQNRLWLSVHCDNCNYDVSLNKVGIPRDGFDIDPQEIRKMQEGWRPFTTKDAYERITMAKTGSLVEEQVTAGYLWTLRSEVLKWVDQIDEAIWKLHPDDVDDAAIDEAMDGDHASALASAGMGTDEDYGCFGNDDEGYC